MTSLPGKKKHNMGAKYIFLGFKVLLTRGIYPFSMVIDSFPFFWFENGIIISQKQNSVKNCWEKQQKLANFMKKGTLKTN